MCGDCLAGVCWAHGRPLEKAERWEGTAGGGTAAARQHRQAGRRSAAAQWLLGGRLGEWSGWLRPGHWTRPDCRHAHTASLQPLSQPEAPAGHARLLKDASRREEQGQQGLGNQPGMAVTLNIASSVKPRLRGTTHNTYIVGRQMPDMANNIIASTHPQSVQDSTVDQMTGKPADPGLAWDTPAAHCLSQSLRNAWRSSRSRKGVYHAEPGVVLDLCDGDPTEGVDD